MEAYTMVLLAPTFQFHIFLPIHFPLPSDPPSFSLITSPISISLVLNIFHVISNAKPKKGITHQPKRNPEPIFFKRTKKWTRAPSHYHYLQLVLPPLLTFLVRKPPAPASSSKTHFTSIVDRFSYRCISYQTDWYQCIFSTSSETVVWLLSRHIIRLLLFFIKKQ
jgi:hypothetical protein